MDLMKAAHVTAFGGPENVIVSDSIPTPQIKEDQLLVKVLAVGLNPFDSKLRSGLFQKSIPIKLPYIPGGDFSGVVLKVGQDITNFHEEDEVYGTASILSQGSGSLAEKVSVHIDHCARKPSSIDHLQAASLPLVGSSAIQALEDHIHVQKNQKILIHGGAGGIGSIAIQLAKYLGAYVITTVSPNDVAYVHRLGADQVIDYTKEDFASKLHGLDAVYDTVGGKVTVSSITVLKTGGILVSMLALPQEMRNQSKDITLIAQNTQTNSKHVERLSELVDQEAIRPQVDKVFPLDQIQAAFHYLEHGSPRGKVVIKIEA